MKRLREGFTTGSCAAAAALASVLWQTKGCCPDMVSLDTPAGKRLYLPVQAIAPYCCGVIKDSGDDPDVTDGCLVTASVEIMPQEGAVRFIGGAGIGTVTKKGLRLPVGEPAINPVPRQMIEQAVRGVIGAKGAVVTVAIPEGERLAEKTMNQRLGIVGGLSVLGTTGIVRPMSEEAVKESLRLALSVCRGEHGTACALVTGYSGELFLKKQFPDCGGIVLCSNYLGFLLDCAEEMGFTHILIAGGAGKLVKPAANIMQLHSHTAGGQREVICTHAALHGADQSQIRQLYACPTTKAAEELLSAFSLAEAVWQSIADSAAENCTLRMHGKAVTAFLLTDGSQQMLAGSRELSTVLEKWRKCHA